MLPASSHNFLPDALPRSPRSSSPPLRSRIRRTSCSWRPPTSTATPPTGTTWPTGRSPAGSRGWRPWWTRSARAIPARSSWWTRATCSGRSVRHLLRAGGAASAASDRSRRSTSRATTRRRRATTTSTGALPFFQQAVADARFPYVSANLYAGRGDSLLFRAWRVVQRAGRPHRDHRPHDARHDGLGPRPAGGRARIAPILPAAAPVLEAMRRDADVTVALVHSGLDGRRPTIPPAWATRTSPAGLATLPARPDVVVVGHSHREMRDSVIGGVHFVQPRPFGASVSVVHLDLAREAGVWRLRRVRADLVSTRDVAASRAAGPAARAAAGRGPRLGPHGDRARDRADARDAPRGSARCRSSTSSRTFSAGAPARELSAASAFDLRAGFDADTIRVAHVLALYPFDNTLRAVRLSGGPAQGVSRMERAVLPGGPGGPDRPQRLGARVQLRCGGRRQLRHRPAPRRWATGSSA